jgi:peptidoglycan hydrolase-like protein with peptidoglycan-binding domain
MSGLGIALPAAAALALFLFTSKSKASVASSAGAAPAAGKSVAQRMAEVIATGDPASISAEAIRLRSEGKLTEASELDRVAGLIAAEHAKGNATPTVVQTKPAPAVKPAPAPAVKPAPAAPSSSAVLQRTSPPVYVAAVVPVQQRLIALGWKLDADGKFGPGTETAVKEFQALNGIKPIDGKVGPVTGAALASSGAKGPIAAAAIAAKPAPAPAPAPAVKPAPAPAAKPAPAPAPAAKPAPAPAAAPAGRSPTITKNLTNLPAILKNGAAANYPAPASNGAAVKDWQQVLFDLGFLTTKPDGKFGPGTEVATRNFQTAANGAAAKSGKPALTVDGKVGPATVARAAEARIMSSGPASFAGDYFGDDSGPLNVPGEPIADTPLPGLMAPMQPVAPSPRRALAARVYNMLELAPKGGEDRTLVALYQSQEGLKPTGYYGPATALSLARSYGIVPPRPLYWTESRTRASKGNYRDAMRLFGEKDPQRVEEWKRAGDV